LFQAAKIIGCKNIIGIDRIESRLQLAQEIGATHTLNTSEGTDLVAEIRNITGGPGVHAVFDTIGVPKLTNESIEYVRNAGSIIQIAMTSPGARWDVSMPDFMITGKSIQGAVGGDVDPHDYLPKLVGYYRDGNLPVEKIVEFYKAKDFQQALKDMRTGKTIKPVLVW
jgi:Zn-dependent alcohol dehydrogenase